MHCEGGSGYPRRRAILSQIHIAQASFSRKSFKSGWTIAETLSVPEKMNLGALVLGLHYVDLMLLSLTCGPQDHFFLHSFAPSVGSPATALSSLEPGTEAG